MSKLSLREIAQSQLDSTPVIDGQLIVCLDTGNAYRDTSTAHVKIGSDLEVVSDLPLAPLAEKLYYLKPDKLYVFLGGNWTLLNDKTIDLDESIAKLPAGPTTDLNDDVEIITQDTDFTQSHYYRRKLVVLWEYIKTKAQDFFAAKDHKHKKADITDFPTSMPASDVHPWAKEATKPSYTKAEVGLSNVDNTADADKTVKRATTAGIADSANSVAWENVNDKPTTFPVEAHNHDDRYYSEAEVDGKLNGKSNTGHTHNYAGSTSSGGAANSANTLNPTVILTGGDGNTTGYRLIGQVSIRQWSSYRCVMLVNSRHQGAGLVTVTIGNNTDTITQGNAYAEIKYWGPTGSGGVISSSAYQVYISDDGKTGYLFWMYWDYSSCYVRVLGSDFTISNGTWMTGIGSGYGKCIATTQVNAASTADYLNYFKCTSSSNVGIDDTSANAVGYVSGISLLGQGDGALYKQVYSDKWVHEIYGDYRTGQIALRGKNNGTWQGWRTVLDSSNYSSYALPRSGGTLSGNIHFADIGNVGTSSGITWGGSTDGAGIYYQTTGADQGNLVLNLTDDYNCFLRIAQNGNFKSYFSPNDGNFHGNVNGTADVANFAKETYISQYKTVNLTDLDQNTWYPVTGDSIPYNGLRRFKCNVQLNSGSKPNWSTHSGGFTAVVDILYESSGWGTTNMQGMVLVNDQFWINDYNKPPVGYSQMGAGSIPVWWLRGGGSYRLAADYDCTWTIRKSTYTNNGQSVSPTTTYPGVYVNRATITANLNGHANTSEVATTGVRDYNNTNNTIRIGWSGANLDANTLAYIAGYTSDMKIHTASKDGVRSWIGLGNAAYKNVRSLSNVGPSGWANQSTDDNYVPTMAFMAFWNGAYGGTSSNLQYCDRGRFGTIVTKNSGDYAVAGHVHNGVKDYNDGNRTIQIGFAGAGLNTSNLKYIAGYTEDNGTKIKDVSKDVLTSWIGLGNYLPLSGGVVTGQIKKDTGGSWIGDRDRVLVRSNYPGDWSYGAVAGIGTKSGFWTMGALGGWEDLVFNYSTDSNYSAGNNSTSQVRLPAQAGTIITSATIGNQTVNRAEYLANDAAYMRMHWNGQSGQPLWLWGGNDASNMYVWNPSNFSVNYANSAGNGTTDFQTKVTSDGQFGAIRFNNGVQICWFTMKNARNKTFLLPFADTNYAIAFSGGYCWLDVDSRTTTGFTTGAQWSGYENSYIAIGRWR